MSTPPLSVPLRFAPVPEAPVRRGEPVTVGLPWPRGAVRDDSHFRLIGPDGGEQLLQTRTLDRWPDGSVRWCLFDFLATVDGAVGGYRIEAKDRLPGVANSPPPGDGAAVIDRLMRTMHFDLLDLPKREAYHRVEVTEPGSVRRRTEFRADPYGGIEVFGHVDTYSGPPVARVTLTVRNPSPADHPGGNWDLGSPGSAFVNQLSVRVQFDSFPTSGMARASVERGQQFQDAPLLWELVQGASGGENWKSANHVNFNGVVPLDIPGYRLSASGVVTEGRRATPVVTLDDSAGRWLGVAVPRFWEEFPKAVTIDLDGITLSLFPGRSSETQELQGGEQKTHTFYVAFGRDAVTDEPMVWCRSPLQCHADPEWYASTGVIPYLTPKAGDPNAAYLALVDQAIEGPDTFVAKREKIDEYGWRHFGDIYGDHEAVGWPGAEPMVSHYNNQYDCVAGFLYQFMRSGDPRWFTQAVECADHTCDIDVYHTDGDKAAYNRGLFWHTYHYAPADTGTHRSYPKALRRGPQASTTTKMDQLGETAEKLKKSYAVGGGPAASHNYNAGLMLAYFLTGNPLYRDTAVDLARFVVDMDDPAKTVFRWLSWEYTGLATESGGGGYHGPGRASGNSVNALLVGRQLTGDRAFLDKAEQIIRRVSHPKQDLTALDLLNAELRWFYTMFLQAIGRYLDTKIELGELDRMYAYGRLTLLHYARWMAAHERPILDTPERLQYPNETWAAQDIRKVEVFQYAAKHATGAEKATFLERAAWFFRYVEATLPGFPTKSLCRPVVLMMNFGWSHAWWQQHPDATAPEPTVAVTADDFGTWRMFLPQKVKAIKRAKTIVVAGAVGVVVAAVALLAWWLG